MFSVSITQMYSEPNQKSKMGPFAKKVNGFLPLTNFRKNSILDV